jgi:16S rRNA processing protein RimM
LSRGWAAVSAGRVGRPHGRDGSFYVDDPDHPLAPGTEVAVGGARRRVERRAGRVGRPIVRLAGVADRSAAAALRGEALVVEGELGDGEWLASELIGCRVAGLDRVRRVLDAPSCDLLELEDGTLIPLVSDAVRRIDPDGGVIEVDLGFLELGDGR